MADETDTLCISLGENPDIVFEFHTGPLETDPRLDLTGATLTVTTNIPDQPTTYTGDQTQGIVVVSVPLNVADAMKKFTDYWITVTAVDADGKRHIATVHLSAK